MTQYLTPTHLLIAWFTKFVVAQVSRLKNRMTDALAKFSSSSLYPYPLPCGVKCLDTLFKGVLPEDKKATTKTKARAARYAIINDILYRRSFLGTYQRCVPSKKARHIIIQIHGGICGIDISGRSLCHIIMM